jgi:peptidoglycan/LPS O-acetylase OafA/YrhL
VVRWIRALAARPALCWGLAVALAVGMVVGLPPSPTAPAFGLGPERTAQSFLQVAIGALAVAPIALRTASVPVLTSRPLTALAGASLGFFLWHIQVLRGVRPLLDGPAAAAVLGLAIAVAVSFLAGEASRRWIEAPARRALTR